MRRSMRLSRPVYELLPFVYMILGFAAMALAYLDPEGPGAPLALGIALLTEVAALTVLLRRRDYRETRREYSLEALEFPAVRDGVRQPRPFPG